MTLTKRVACFVRREHELVEETTVVEPDEQALVKWWSKKLKEKLRYLQKKLEHITYGLKDFRLTGLLGSSSTCSRHPSSPAAEERKKLRMQHSGRPT
jgi:hypothetical protein